LSVGPHLLILLCAIGAVACAPLPGLTSVPSQPATSGVPPSPTPSLQTPSLQTPSLPTESLATLSTRPSGDDPVAAVLVGAGDIADCSTGSATTRVVAATARLVEGLAGTVFTAGDNAYVDGTASEFIRCYDPTWGTFKDRTLLPAPGNHDLNTPGGTGYFGYFGARAGTPGEGWYSRDIGGWHVVVLNSNCTIVGCDDGSPQLEWLKADLTAHPAACTLAIWHHPRFSSGQHGNDRAVSPFWRVLQAAHAELVVNGHDHDYERFAPQDPSGRLDRADGIREIVVGTGGTVLRPFAAAAPNSEAADARTHGVIVLTLRTSSYDWRFVPVAGKTFADGGSAACH
jgi:3',5'-cyclic AMP phosphodiesterase CpdA